KKPPQGQPYLFGPSDFQNENNEEQDDELAQYQGCPVSPFAHVGQHVLLSVAAPQYFGQQGGERQGSQQQKASAATEQGQYQRAPGQSQQAAEKQPVPDCAAFEVGTELRIGIQVRSQLSGRHARCSDQHDL